MTALAARDVTVRFGGLTAVDAATIEVPEGGFVGLIGPNGAGKTTLFNVICGFQAATSGTVIFGERTITDLPASARARLGIGRTFQRLELFGRMTVFDNLMVATESRESNLDIVSDLLNLPRRRSEERRCGETVERIMRMTNLAAERDRPAGELPVGTARVLELARALCAGPSLLLLDEPSSGLDSDETHDFGALLTRINGDLGIGILIVEHDVDLVMEVCRDVFVLDFGRVIGRGTPKQIMADPAVRAAYLGEEDDAAAASPAQR